jgi:hypothetical protein
MNLWRKIKKEFMKILLFIKLDPRYNQEDDKKE